MLWGASITTSLTGRVDFSPREFATSAALGAAPERGEAASEVAPSEKLLLHKVG